MFAVIGQYRFSVPIQMETRFLQFQIFALHEPYIIFKFIYSVTCFENLSLVNNYLVFQKFD
jgi:hypothetical protein